ncbi:MAG: TVP38/TMEM64 family protein [Planctomycetota bacterium]|jgi:uncharacterized membrane protein YdjX (TVP38/TMEM64 family)
MSNSAGNPANPPEESASHGQGKWRPILLLLFIVCALVAAKLLGLDRQLGNLEAWIKRLGPWGPLAFIGIYTLAMIAAIPGSILIITGGVLFGTWLGTGIVSIASTLGASLCFLISRYFARAATARWLERSERFRRLDKMTEEYGHVIVAITRLIPIFPCSLLNYGFGLTGVGFWTFVFWSWLCMLPVTFLFVAGGHVGTQILKGRVEWPVIAVACSVFVLLLILIAILRRKWKADRLSKTDSAEKKEDHEREA